MLLCAAAAHDCRGVFCHVKRKGSVTAGAITCCTMRVARCCTLQCEPMGLARIVCSKQNMQWHLLHVPGMAWGRRKLSRKLAEAN